MKRDSHKAFTLAVTCLYLILIPVACADPVTIQYFHQKDCHDCEIADPIVIE